MFFFLMACHQSPEISKQKIPVAQNAGSDSQVSPVDSEQQPKSSGPCQIKNPERISTPSGFAMKLIPSGQFTMGHNFTADRHEDEEPHLVHITQPFYLAETEMTQSVWHHMIGKTPTPADDCGEQCPVKMVSWCDAVQFANLISAVDGLVPAYQLPNQFQLGLSADTCNELSRKVSFNRGANGYRLPTEAEWEFAARGMQQTHYPGSNDPSEVGWWKENSDGKLHPVAQKLANGFGLFDMLGNVWEWCWDLHAPYSATPQIDPIGPAEGHSRIHRGGAYDFGRGGGRLGNRNRSGPDNKSHAIGFRLAKSAPCNP